MLALQACAQNRPADRKPEQVETSAPDTRTKTGTGSGSSTTVSDALLQPVEDLNLKRTAIPEILLQLDGVYVSRELPDCDQITAELAALTEVLGPDAATMDKPSAKAQAAAASIDAMSGFTGGLIPFRGLVRRATGATAHEKKIRAAFLTGLQRRAYLNGLALAAACSDREKRSQ